MLSYVRNSSLCLSFTHATCDPQPFLFLLPTCIVFLNSPSYKFRVRWKPRGCLCAASSASQSMANSSSMQPNPNRNCDACHQSRPVAIPNGNSSQIHKSDRGNSADYRYPSSTRKSSRAQPRACIHGHIERHVKCSHCSFLQS